jgi:hypothetical protein
VRAAPVLLLAALLAGCGGYVHDTAKTAAAGAVDAVTAPAAQKALDATAAGAARAASSAAVTAARDVVFSPATTRAAGKMVVALGDDLRPQVALLREELAGAPLRADVDKLIDEATPRLAAAVAKALAPIKADADAAASKYEKVAIGLAVAAGVLLLALAFSVWELRRHKRALGALLTGARRHG